MAERWASGDPRWLAKGSVFLSTAGQAYRDDDFDSCVSRSYYAVFYAINALIPEALAYSSHVAVFNLCSSWNRTHTALDAVGVLRGQRNLHRSLKELHEWREDADYRIGEIDGQKAQSALRFATRFVDGVREVMS